MKKIFIVVACLLAITSATFGQATNWDISGRPNSDWFSGNNTPRDVAHMWMKAVDPLIAGGAINAGTGRHFYVDSNVTNEGDGTNWANAKDTWEEGVQLCTANRGDVVWFAPGHAETGSTAGVDMDIAGVTYIALGYGADRATFSQDTTTDTIIFGADGDGSSIHNMRFIATVTAVAVGVQVEAGCTNWTINNCTFEAETTTVDEFTDTIEILAAADRGTITNCTFFGDPGTNAEPQAAINFLDCDYLQIFGNVFTGDYAVATINNETTASNFINIAGNIVFNGIIGGTAGLNALPCVVLHASTSGTIVNNAFFCNVATPDAAVTGADIFMASNFYSETEAIDAIPIWLADNVNNIIGFDDAANLGLTSNVVADEDGSIVERLEQIGEVVNKGTGTSIGADSSLVDAIGHTGLAFGTSGLGYWTPKTTSKVATGTDDDLWDVVGGDIEIFTLYGIVTTVIGATATTCEIQIDNDLGASYDHDFSTAIEITLAAEGAAFVFDNTIGESVMATNTGLASSMVRWYCPEGMVEQNMSTADNTGAITWYMTYAPLETGVTVTAQ